MSDENKMVGTQFPPFTLTVERGKIKEFAKAIGDDNPIYYDPVEAQKQGYRDVITPPTFGTVIDLWGGSDFHKMCSFLNINPVMVLHGEQEYEYFGEINPGDEIVGTTSVAGYHEKKNMNLFILVTNYVDQKGDLVMKCRKTIIERKAG